MFSPNLTKHAKAALAASALVALAAPATAAAHRYETWAGSPADRPSSAPKEAQLNAFFPATLRIRAGDSVTWRNNEFHTVSVLPRGGKAPTMIVADPAGGRYEPLHDPTGAPFHFNGRQKFIWNPAVFAPAGGKAIDGRRTVSSGAFGGRDGKVTYRFTRPGTYTVVCLLHPGMKQKVVVLPERGRKRPQRDAAVKAAIAGQSARAWRQASELAKTAAPAATVHAGSGGRSTLLAFLPQSLTVKAGTTVTFLNRSPSEIHNMVFGPQDYVEDFYKKTELFPFGPGAPNQVSPASIYGSEAAEGGQYVHTGRNLSNGFLVTPLIDAVAGDPPAGLPGAVRVRFDQPGRYSYFCALHGPDMSGEIVVTG